jgi:CPA2 family monovalent cation:H+ antiporter-2
VPTSIINRITTSQDLKTGMPHDTPLIATIVAGLGLAFIFGTIANRLRLPPIVGYILAGVVLGPYTPGMVADQKLAPELAEIGVILLMFGIGLHFSLKELLSVRAIAIPGAIVQIAAATALGAGLAWYLGWSMAAGLVFGLSLSVASTVVLLKALQERRLVKTERGRIAVGWLIVEDLVTVLALVLLPALATLLGTSETAAVSDPIAAYFNLGLPGVFLLTFLKVGAFIALMLIVGRRVIPWALHYVAHTGSRELFRLAVLAIALGVAYGAAELFGVSFALGAFFAGMVMSESELSQRAAEESLPLRDAFAVLFFVSVGMLFDPLILINNPLPILATLFIVMIGKSAAAFLIVRAFGHPTGTALTISASLAQIGEFSFILAELGVKLNLLPEQGRDLILVGAILSILLNPLAFAAAERLKSYLERGAPVPATEPDGNTSPPPEEKDEAALATTSLRGHVVLVGYGRVGSLVGQALKSGGRPFLVIEYTDDKADELKAQGIEMIVGNAAQPDISAAANIVGAGFLVVAIPDAFEAGQVVEQARHSNSALQILARAHSDAEVEHLRAMGANVVIMGEREIAREMIDHLARSKPKA